MIGGFQDAAKIPELRRRVLFTAGMLVIYRLGVFVPTPGIDTDKVRRLFEQSSNTLFGIVNMFSGGALENFSVFALGIMPYISVSIVIQILSSTVKHLEELKKEGQEGQRVITRYTRIGTIALALFQGTMISIGLEGQGVVAEPGWEFRILTAITLTAGTAFIMWVGEQITERGIGNGISIIIMAGILARMPSTMVQTLGLMSTGEVTAFTMLGILLFALVTIAFIVFVERAQRRLPVQYPRRASGKGMTPAQTQYLPLKVNMSGVIPPIFASALMVFPATIAQLGQIEWEPMQQFMALLQYGSFWYNVVFGVLIVFFCYFYTTIVFDPKQIAENLKRNGGFIPTVRPGKDTAQFITSVLNRLTMWGSIYIALVCILPSIFYMNMGATAFTFFFGGTAILIVVGVTMDTASQMESHVVARNYEGFMNKSPGKMRGAARGSNVKGRLIQR